jgi:sialate O-acetylesterase
MILLLTVCGFRLAQAALEPAGVFSDSMVLQRNMKVPIWGWATVGEQITLVYNGQTVTATARDSSAAAYKGYWKAWFSPMNAGGPYDLTITGSLSNTVIFRNVLIGDVWICSGQSNMWYSMTGNYINDNSPEAQTLPPSGQPITKIRMCRIGSNVTTVPVLDLQRNS